MKVKLAEIFTGEPKYENGRSVSLAPHRLNHTTIAYLGIPATPVESMSLLLAR
jgi:hypothetical protein